MTNEYVKFLVTEPEELTREALYAKERALVADEPGASQRMPSNQVRHAAGAWTCTEFDKKRSINGIPADLTFEKLMKQRKRSSLASSLRAQFIGFGWPRPLGAFNLYLND